MSLFLRSSTKHRRRLLIKLGYSDVCTISIRSRRSAAAWVGWEKDAHSGISATKREEEREREKEKRNKERHTDRYAHCCIPVIMLFLTSGHQKSARWSQKPDKTHAVLAGRKSKKSNQTKKIPGTNCFEYEIAKPK